MKMGSKAIVFVAMVLAVAAPVHADLNSDMQDMFDSLGVMGNYSSPTSFTAQGRGYFVGGGVSARTPIKSIVPLSFERPSFSAGCGGIDMHLGSLSFANLDAYKNFFQALPNAAIGYGLKVGLDAISPTLRKAFDSVEDIVNKVNQYAMNSCQAAQMAVNGAVGLIEETNLERCKQRKIAEGKDATQAETQCKGSAADVASGGASGPESLKPVTGNVVWKALAKVDGLTTDDRELIMSIFGTVVIKSGEEPLAFPPTISTFQEFFKGQPDPGAAAAGPPAGLLIYRCDGADCLNPAKQFSALKTFPVRVEERMHDIADRLLNSQPQNAINIGFVNGTKFPVFRMLVLATASGDGSMADSFAAQYRDVIAIELAISYIDKLVAQANAIMSTSQHSLSTAEARLLTSITRVGRDFKTAAREEEKSLTDKVKARQDLQADLENLQKAIYGSVPENVRRLITAGR
jgi:conjugative transfer pilus assembly protein TraH